LKRDGALFDVITERKGFLNDYSFVRDRDGNMYWAERGESTVIKKRATSGAIETHATGPFQMVQFMTARPDGTLFLMDRADLRRVSTDGKVSTVATRLSSHKSPPANVSDRNYHMGLWTDSSGAVYVAVPGERLVLQVQADGRTKVVARSGEPWSPSGGMFDRDGDLWLLECNSANAVRARRIDRAKQERVFNTQMPRQ
jgi:sugar lactone lactonase YvrE